MTTNAETRIPRIVHQLWKDDEIPPRWHGAVDSVKRLHKGWEYRLWTDERMMRYVETKHRDFFPIFASMNRHIMRVDVFRYILMHDFGGLYCDLDYEFVRPYDYSGAAVVLSMEYDTSYGDDVDQVANYVFASAPQHAFWADILEDLRINPPSALEPADVCIVTGPQLVSRIFFRNRDRYKGVRVTPKPVLSPRRVHGRYERKFYINSGITYGFHRGWGSWRERWSLEYVRSKLAKWTGAKKRGRAATAQH